MDIWSRKLNTISYLGITVHYIQEDEMKSCILGICYSDLLIIELAFLQFFLLLFDGDFTGVFELDDHHTIDYLVSCIEKILNKCEVLTNKVHTVITDRPANIVGAVKKMFSEAKHLYCFAYILNLIVNATTRNDENNSKLITAIEKLKTIVTWFHQSVVAAQQC